MKSLLLAPATRVAFCPSVVAASRTAARGYLLRDYYEALYVANADGTRVYNFFSVW